VREFDTDTIKLIAAFEDLSKTEVRDCCINSDSIYFLVNTGKIAVAIGKGGQTIKQAEKMFKKPIKIFEWAESDEEFLKNMIPNAKKVTIKDGSAQVLLDSKNRGAVLGRAGSNIKAIRELLERNSNIKELKVI